MGLRLGGAKEAVHEERIVGQGGELDPPPLRANGSCSYRRVYLVQTGRHRVRVGGRGLVWAGIGVGRAIGGSHTKTPALGAGDLGRTMLDGTGDSSSFRHRRLVATPPSDRRYRSHRRQLHGETLAACVVELCLDSFTPRTIHRRGVHVFRRHGTRGFHREIVTMGGGAGYRQRAKVV